MDPEGERHQTLFLASAHVTSKRTLTRTPECYKFTVATKPFGLQSRDFLLLDRGKGGYEYILVIRDHSTRYFQDYLPFPPPHQDTLWQTRSLVTVLKFSFLQRIHQDQRAESANNFTPKVTAQLTHLAELHTSMGAIGI